MTLEELAPRDALSALLELCGRAAGAPARLISADGRILSGPALPDPCAPRDCACAGAFGVPVGDAALKRRCEHGSWYVAAPVVVDGRVAACVTVGGLPRATRPKLDALRACVAGAAAGVAGLATAAGAPHTEGALESARRLLREVTEYAPGVIFELRVRPETGSGIEVLYLSPRSRDVLGIDNDVAGFAERLRAAAGPEGSERLSRSMREAAGSRSPWIHEDVLTKPSGERVWFRIEASPREREGTLVYSGFLTDITQRRRTEEALQSERDQLLSIFDSIEALIYVADLDTHDILYVNAHHRRLLGRDVVGGKCYREFQNRDSPCPFCTNPIIVKQKPAPYRWEFYNPHLDAHLDITDRVITWPDGRDVRFEIAVDVTRRKRSEEDLAVRVRYEEGLASCAQALVSQDDKAIERAIGHLLTAADVSRVYIFENFHDPDDGVCIRQTHEVCAPGVEPQIDSPALRHVPYRAGLSRWIDNLAAGRPISGRVADFPPDERQYLAPQGILSLLVLPINVSGSLYGFVGFDDTAQGRSWQDEDIHMLQTAAGMIGRYIEHGRIEQQLRQAQKTEAVGRLAAGIAHDFNNMLTPILGFADLLAEDLRPSDPSYQMVQGIRTAAEQSRGLVRQLLSYSRRQVLELSIVDLRVVVGGMEKLLRRTLRETIDVKIVADPEPCLIKVDVPQIEQVLLNLALNSQDAMPAGGTLTIEVHHTVIDDVHYSPLGEAPPGHYAVLAVSDSGHGMDRETREHIFEPFFTTKEKGRGTGLGLATVYGSVRQHGGSISFRSAVGRGTTFTILFPLQEEGSMPSADVPRPERPRRGDETIMLVEDNGMVRGLAEAILRQQGYSVMSASSGAECLKLLDGYTGPLHLLLTDVIMPDMNGRELYEALAGRFPATRVLYMSGYTDDVIADKGVLQSGVSFIQKPFSMQGLAAKIRDTLAGS